MNLEQLPGEIEACTRCSLCQSRLRAVPGEGPMDAAVMLVGEAPGADEDRLGRPFVGRAGRILDRALDMASLERERIFITNVVKCRPPNNRRPLKGEMAACLPHLRAQMELLHPRVICLMGNVALGAVLGMQGVMSLHGQTIQDRYLVTVHPAAVVRNRRLMELFVSDLQEIKRMLRD
ncbi:MAG: uracil-DNA glycosylase [Methanosarcinales archaeon]|nr:uracil-DNA glycosylase [Methanosarcinales archaeon]